MRTTRIIIFALAFVYSVAANCSCRGPATDKYEYCGSDNPTTTPKWCYVKSPSTCSDAVASKAGGKYSGVYYSAEVCKIKHYYEHKAKACINGANMERISDKSVAECEEICNARTDCKAFEYGVNYGGSNLKPKDCYLQNNGANWAGCKGAANNADLYIKKGLVTPKPPTTQEPTEAPTEAITEAPTEAITEAPTPCTYTHMPKKCVNGENIKPLYKGKSVAQCKTLCDARKDCLGIEYGVAYGGSGSYKPGDCQLSSGANTAGCNAGMQNLDFYKKGDCTGVTQPPPTEVKTTTPPTTQPKSTAPPKTDAPTTMAAKTAPPTTSPKPTTAAPPPRPAQQQGLQTWGIVLIVIVVVLIVWLVVDCCMCYRCKIGFIYYFSQCCPCCSAYKTVEVEEKVTYGSVQEEQQKV